MNTKHYLIISGIVGGVIGSLLTALLVPPVAAQRDKFGEIECTKLTVVDEEGIPRVILNTDFNQNDFDYDDRAGVFITGTGTGGYVYIDGEKGNRGNLMISTSLYGGRIYSFDKDGDQVASLTADEYGGCLRIHHKDDNKDGKLYAKSVATLKANPGGGHLAVSTKDWGGGMAVLGSDGEIGPYLELDYKDPSNPQVRLYINDHGGSVVLSGKSEGKAFMGINEYGNGSVSTWDKNGYRQK